MPKKLDFISIASALTALADFHRNLGKPAEAETLEGYAAQLASKQGTKKLVHGEISDAVERGSAALRPLFWDRTRRFHPGMEATYDRYVELYSRFEKLCFPPEWEEMDISNFVGSEHVEKKIAPYKGSPEGVRPIVERTIAFVRHYCELIGAGKLPEAYQLTDNGLRSWMPFGKFLKEHEEAAAEYGGPALEFHIGQFQFVYADAASREEGGASEEGWANNTSKHNRRSCVTGFWIRNREKQFGCGGGLSIAEEDGEYRIGVFTFWRP